MIDQSNGPGIFNNTRPAYASSPRHARFDAAFAALAAVLALIIAYVSLYPFRPHPHAGSPWLIFFADSLAHQDHFDVLSNILLYVPLGFCLARCIDFVPKWPCAAIGTLIGALLSLAIELTQVYDVGRSSSVWDFGANSAGALLGAIVGVSAAALSSKVFPAMMVLCWLGFRLVSPWAPAQPVVRAVVPSVALSVVLSVTTRVVEAFEMFSAWLGVGLLLQSVFGAARSRWVLALSIAIGACVPLWVISALRGREFALTAGNAAELAGACLALLLWFILTSSNRPVPFALLVAIFFAIFVCLDALRPYHFLPHARHFGLIPFLGLIQSSRVSAFSSTLSKVFMYGTLLWSATRAGLPLKWATMAGAILVLALRLMQVYLPGRSAEITDVLMLLLIASALKVLQRANASSALSWEGPQSGSPRRAP